MFIEIFGGIMA
jgi:hypothetical protein